MYKNIGVGIPNPSSVYCDEHGGSSEIRTNTYNQNQYGVCKFSDGTECEEWEFYKGECQPGQCRKIDADASDKIVCSDKVQTDNKKDQISTTTDKSSWIIGGIAVLFTVFVGGAFIASK